MKIVEKPWGREVWFAVTDRYAGKEIFFKKGRRSSLQFHRTKHETLYVMGGIMKVSLEDENGQIVDHNVHRGEAIVVPPTRKHRVEAIEDLTLIEVSTPEVDDVVRVADDYGR